MTDTLETLSQRALYSSRPWKALWEVTHRCNLHCSHCYITPRAEEAPRDDIARGLRRAGVLFVALSGGEPLCHPHFAELVEALRKERLAWRLLTNGTLIDRGNARFIKEHGASAVDVSILGTGSTHDRITGVEGSYEAALKGIRYLREEGVRVFIKHVSFAANRGQAQAVKALAGELGCGFILDTTLVKPAGGYTGDTRPLTLEETIELYRLIPPEKATSGNLCDEVMCSAGRSTLRVLPDGKVTPCVAFDVVVGNITDRSFPEDWKKHPFLVRLRRITPQELSACTGCEFRELCVRCAGIAYQATGVLTAPDEHACRKARALFSVLQEARQDQR